MEYKRNLMQLFVHFLSNKKNVFSLIDWNPLRASHTKLN